MTPGTPKGGDVSKGVSAPERTSSPTPVNVARVLTSDERGGEAPLLDDLVLVRRAQAGERAAFKTLFERYHRRVYAVALSVLRSPADAHDVVQEAFVKVYRHLPDFQGNSSFYTWLYRISMNLSIDQLRRRKSARHVDYDDAVGRAEAGDDPANLTPVFEGADPSRRHARSELAAKMQAALATLPEYHQQVILLREIEGLSYEEIAKIMKVPKGTIMSRLFHARRKMQTALADYVDGELEPQDPPDSAP